MFLNIKKPRKRIPPTRAHIVIKTFKIIIYQCISSKFLKFKFSHIMYNFRLQNLKSGKFCTVFIPFAVLEHLANI